jgi:hypothetical protein
VVAASDRARATGALPITSERPILSVLPWLDQPPEPDAVRNLLSAQPAQSAGAIWRCSGQEERRRIYHSGWDKVLENGYVAYLAGALNGG